MNRFQSSDAIARSKIKKLRNILKEGEDAAEYFIDYSRADIGKVFTGDRSLIFDAIEIMDVYASGKE